MLDSVLLAGDEDAVAAQIRAAFDWGADELLASVITVATPPNPAAAQCGFSPKSNATQLLPETGRNEV